MPLNSFKQFFSQLSKLGKCVENKYFGRLKFKLSNTKNKITTKFNKAFLNVRPWRKLIYT